MFVVRLYSGVICHPRIAYSSISLDDKDRTLRNGITWDNEVFESNAVGVDHISVDV